MGSIPTRRTKLKESVMLWSILYLLPLVICMLGCLFIIKTEKKLTRRELALMILIFVPLFNMLCAVGCCIAIWESKEFQNWLDVPVIDRVGNSDVESERKNG